MRNTPTRTLAGVLAVATTVATLALTNCGGGSYVTNRLTEPVGDGMLIIADKRGIGCGRPVPDGIVEPLRNLHPLPTSKRHHLRYIHDMEAEVLPEHEFVSAAGVNDRRVDRQFTDDQGGGKQRGLRGTEAVPTSTRRSEP